MKIDTTIKREHLPTYVQEHLMFFDSLQKNGLVAGITFAGLDVLIAVPLFYPTNSMFFWALFPFLLFINIWAIRLLFKNSYSIQYELILFIGSIGAIGSYTYYLLALKMAYHYVNITEPIYYIISLAIFIISVISLIVYQIKKYSNIQPVNNKERELEEIIKERKEKYYSVAAIFPALGYFVAQNWIVKSDNLALGILVLIFYLMSFFYAYIGAKFFHRYFFMKANPSFVHLLKPSKSEIKEMRKKGKEIIIK